MTQCIICGEEMPEGGGWVCPVCEAKSGTKLDEDIRRHLHCAQERIEDLEMLLFAFVWNNATAPFGKHLKKNELEIGVKTLEVIDAAEKMINYPAFRRRLKEAKAEYQKRLEVHNDETNIETDS